MKPGTFKECSERVELVIRQVQRDLDDELPTSALAHLAGFSPFHFQRVFKSLAGESVQTMVRRLRMERTADQLASSSQPIGLIARSARYESHEAFTRSFREHFGVTPHTFRCEELRAGWLPSPIRVHYAHDAFGPLLNRRAPAVTAEIRDLPSFSMHGVEHRGPFVYAGATWTRFFQRLSEAGIDPLSHRWINMAYELDDRTPPEEIVGHIGIVVDSAAPDWSTEHRIGGGTHVVSQVTGSPGVVVDHWYRLFHEYLPRSGWQLRPGPLYQSCEGREAVYSPYSFTTTIYIPVERRGVSL